MDNLDIYKVVRTVPEEAIRPIQAGRLKGKSDINPMWRIKTLTELFGPCGIGWKYNITKQWTEPGGNSEVAAFVNIDLFIKIDDKWSEPIPGTGGSAFVAKEKNGPYVNDECYKMALTDAISVACKALGFAADVYWESGRTKYDVTSQHSKGNSKADEPKEYKCCDCGKKFEGFTGKDGKAYTGAQAYHISEKMNTDGKARCGECMKKAGTRKEPQK